VGGLLAVRSCPCRSGTDLCRKKMTIHQLCNICWWIFMTCGQMWSVQIDLVKSRPNCNLDDLWPNHLDQYDFYEFQCRLGPNTVQVQKLDLDGIWTWTDQFGFGRRFVSVFCYIKSKSLFWHQRAVIQYYQTYRNSVQNRPHQHTPTPTQFPQPHYGTARHAQPPNCVCRSPTLSPSLIERVIQTKRISLSFNFH